MPELPEVETVARSLRPRLVGERIVAVETSGLPLRRPLDRRALAAACDGSEILAVRRRGKYLLIDLSSEHVLITHLGMSGRLLFAEPGTARPPHTHVVFSIDQGDRGDRSARKGLELRYVDPRRFGSMNAYRQADAAAAPELKVLGVDPLEPAFTLAYLTDQLAQARRELKAFLLDQTRIAGLGNIYACEALYEAGLAPRRRTDRLGPLRTERLYRAIDGVLRRGVANRGTTFSDYVDAEGSVGSNQHQLRVYGRAGELCRCGRTVRRLIQGARSTFYCPGCQR